jgi:SAM-dependent methyltransferase
VQELRTLLRCPQCGSEVKLGSAAVCAQGHGYPIVQGIPVFVSDETLEHDPQYAGQRVYFDAEFQEYERYELENWRLAYLDRLCRAGALAGPVVDVGVGGSGYTVIEAARAGVPAIGCDLSLEGLLAAQRFARAEGVAEHTLWVCCSAEQLPLASASFVSALAIAVLEHVPDDRAALREIARVLRPGGRAWVTVPHALQHVPAPLRRASRRHDRALGHLRRYEAERLIADGEAAGLEPVEVQFTGHAIKVLQLIAGRLGDTLWWWCERRDRGRQTVRRGSMQLSVVFARA